MSGHRDAARAPRDRLKRSSQCQLRDPRRIAGVPEAHGAVVTGAGELAAIGRERHPVDRGGVALEGGGQLAGGGVPERTVLSLLALAYRAAAWSLEAGAAGTWRLDTRLPGSDD